MRAGAGQIINIASLSAFGAVPGLSIYAGTKAGVLNFTTSLQGDLRQAGIDIAVHARCSTAARSLRSYRPGEAGSPVRWHRFRASG
jgi:short-subunit dehydrogenase